MKDLDKPTESAEQIAARKWKNNQLRQKIKASRVPAPVVVDPKAPPEIASVIKNAKKPREHYGFERKFIKDIREMMEGHKERNILIQRWLLQREKRRLLLEKLRRYELAEREEAERDNADWDKAKRQNATKSRDLFS
jgi:hypothetical protein